ncbi:uncharacterized protein Dana_GF17271 [Drosophila ananassae]|uniref:Uncharacterized protein n=1 Tax=Drosophila ananassae TaxID=7217 RepID=B3LZ16_DROAN|nr:uncharacterized protein LOC6500056 [Drosophila ananassae]EDV41890.1 uncharacterized protein Dana_GF17271 [Drosophila ananassae]
MKAITFCLLVLVSATFVLTTKANAIASKELGLDSEFDWETELDELLDELDNDEDYMDVEQLGFIRSVRKVLRKALKTVRGTNCIIKEVVEILSSCTAYVDAIDNCGTAIPKDVAKIVASVKKIISICNDILHLRSKLCAADDSSSSTAKNSCKCFWNLFKATMKLTRQINKTLKLIAKLPSDTSECFVSATNNVKVSFNSFLPNINVCVDSM